MWKRMTVFTTFNMQALIINKCEEEMREDKCIVTSYILRLYR